MNQLHTTRHHDWPAARPQATPFDALAPRHGRAPEESQSSIGDIAAAVRRNLWRLAAWTLVCLGLAAAYVVTAKPEFVALAQVVLEPRRPATISTVAAAVDPGQTLDSAQADSQLQVIRSERNLRFVFDALDLAHSPLFAPEPPGLLSKLLAYIPLGADPPMTPEERAEAASNLLFQTFTDHVTTRRIGQSYVLEVSVRAPNPTDAARIANSIVAAYIRDQVLFNAASVQHGSEYLQGRIADIKAQQDVATDAVKRGIVPDYQFGDADAQIVGGALKPLSKAYPQTTLIMLLALVLGLFSGIGVIVVHQGLDRVVRSRKQVARWLGVDCLGALPRLTSAELGLRKAAGRPWDLASRRPDSSFAREFRSLRTTLFSGGAEGRHRAIGVVSCLPREGRSLFAANLAFLLGASRTPAVLVDADLQNPTLTRALVPKADVGLADVLAGPAGDVALPWAALRQNLVIVPATSGDHAADPNLYLGSSALAHGLARLRSERDVVVDLPPLTQSSDAQAIGPLLDGVVLLATVNRTTLDQVAEALRLLHLADVRVLGVVLNANKGRPPDAASRRGLAR